MVANYFMKFSECFHGIFQRTLTVGGEVSLYNWSPVLKVLIQLLHYIQINYFILWSNPVM